MQFGKKNKDVPVFSGNSYIRNLKGGETTVRFLEECDEWVMYREHYSEEGKSFPCTNERNTCPGCTHPLEKVSRSSRRYGANVLIKPQDTHVVIRLPVTAVNRLEARSERNNGTILDRDYSIIRFGEGLDTDYDVENGDKYEQNLGAYELFDVEEMLATAFEEANGALGDNQSPKVEPEDDIPPSKPQVQNNKKGAEEEVVITEKDLRNMDLFELTKIVHESDLVMPNVKTADELVDFILKELAS